VDLTATSPTNNSDDVQHLPAVTPGSPDANQQWGLTTHQDDTDQRSPHQWIIDSGCTNHMTFNKELFEHVKPFNGSVSIADNSHLMIKGIGTVPLRVPTGCEADLTQEILLHNVFYVPKLKKNLISVSQAQRK
jgi:hypothetical protein